MALGFAGMAMLGVQFFLTARFRRASAPFGIDIIYYIHRYLALMAITSVFLHLLIIRIDNAEALMLLNPLQAPWHMSAGRLSLLLFVLLIITSLWRKLLRIHYDQWRMLHIGLAVTAFLLALAHIKGVGYYIDAPAKRWLWSGYTLFWLLLIIYVRLIKPWQMHRHHKSRKLCSPMRNGLKPDSRSTYNRGAHAAMPSPGRGARATLSTVSGQDAPPLSCMTRSLRRRGFARRSPPPWSDSNRATQRWPRVIAMP